GFLVVREEPGRLRVIVGRRLSRKRDRIVSGARFRFFLLAEIRQQNGVTQSFTRNEDVGFFEQSAIKVARLVEFLLAQQRIARMNAWREKIGVGGVRGIERLLRVVEFLLLQVNAAAQVE